MVLEFSATLINYFGYANNYAMKSNRAHDSWTDENGWTNTKLSNADCVPVIIPHYQRKLVWERKDIETLFTSSGKLLGNITFARPKPKNEGAPTALSLVDGLQRFSAITAIMRSLWNNVLSEDPVYPNATEYFGRLIENKTEAMPNIWQHNHNMLENSTRVGIRDSYAVLVGEVDELVVEKLKSQNRETIANFAEQIQNTLFNKNLAIDVYGGFTSQEEIIETFKDVNSTGVKLSHIDLLRARIIAQTEPEKCNWANEDVIAAENRFTVTLQPETDSRFNKDYRKIFGLRLYQAFNKNQNNVFPDWDELTPKALYILCDYIDNCEANQKQKPMGSNTEYTFPYLEEIFQCGSLPFISFIWYYYQNHYVLHLNEITEITNSIKEEYQQESINDTDNSAEISEEEIENHVIETLEQLKNAKETIVADTEKLKKENIKEETKKKYEDKISQLESLQEKYPNYYADLPDFLGGELDTTENALLFLRASYRRVMNGNVGTTAPIVDRLMNKEITTMQQLANEFNPGEQAGDLQNAPNAGWLRSSLDRKKGTSNAKYYFNACLLPNRDDVDTDFPLLVYGSRTGQWNIDHLIPKTRIATGEGAIDGHKIVNFAPLDRAHNIAAQSINSKEKLRVGGEYYAEIMDYHPYCQWLVETHYVEHENDEDVDGKHPLNRQESIVHNHQSGIGDQRIEQLILLLTPKL